jgi:hypothetical protein
MVGHGSRSFAECFTSNTAIARRTTPDGSVGSIKIQRRQRIRRWDGMRVEEKNGSTTPLGFFFVLAPS